MKNILIVIACLSFSVSALAWGSGSSGRLVGNIKAAKSAIQAANMDDEKMAKLSLESVQYMDENNPVAADGDPYAERLKTISKGMEEEEGLKLNFKAYKVTDVNAFATPDGSVRVFAGLMDKMNDDEIRAVLGHEIGHVKLSHSKKQYQKALALASVKEAALANTGGGNVLPKEQMAGFMENILNAKFSREDESAADEYGFNFLVKHKFNYHAMEGAFSKLAALEGGDDKGRKEKKESKKSLMASHPDSAERAKIAKERAAKEDANPTAPATSTPASPTKAS